MWQPDAHLAQFSRRENFDDSDLQVLEVIKLHFCNAMRDTLRIAKTGPPNLSSGVEGVERGPSVEWLRSVRGPRFANRRSPWKLPAFSTVRTHSRRVYEKLGAQSHCAGAFDTRVPMTRPGSLRGVSRMTQCA